MVESIDSVKLAQTLDKAAAKRSTPLNVMIQVNTSAEECKEHRHRSSICTSYEFCIAKNGVEPGKDVLALVELILHNCKVAFFWPTAPFAQLFIRLQNLKFTGLMTIGSPEAPPERDFQVLPLLLPSFDVWNDNSPETDRLSERSCFEV